MLLVALPSYLGDVHLMLKNLRWQYAFCGQQPTKAVLVCDPRFSKPLIQSLEKAARNAYSSVHTLIYPTPSREGWPQAPNWVFQHTARYMQQFGMPWLFMEPDAVPVKVDWLNKLSLEYNRGRQPFMGPQVPVYGHINGVSVYPHDTPQRLLTAMGATDKAWDTECAREMVPYCHVVNHLIAHLWGVLDGRIVPFDGVPPRWLTQESLTSIPPTALLVHRDKILSIADRLSEQRNGHKLNICTMNHNRTEIFIVSYEKDLVWLGYCLKSIRKFARGFCQTNVLVPTDQRHLFEPLQREHRFTLLDYQTPSDPVKWHIAHQLEKMRADLHCPEAGLVLHVDSDCIFTEPVTPEDYMVDGKPVMLIEPYSKMQGTGSAAWQSITEDILKFPVTHETMRRHPQINPRGVYADLRAHVEKVQGVPFADFILSRKPDFMWGVSEHNCIGAFALHSEKWSKEYHWIDLETNPRPPDKLHQNWSHSPIDEEQTFPSTGERGIPKELFDKVLA